MKSLNGASFFIFFYPLYLCSSITMGHNRELPQELFLKVITYIVPNFKSPTHPEEIEYQDNQLNSYRSVCKEWQGFLDRRLTFKDLEQLFIVKYHWPWKAFAPFWMNHFDVLDRSSVDQPFVMQQYQISSDYSNMMYYINQIKNQKGHDHTERVRLQFGIENDFYSYLYCLLENKDYYVWQELFDYAIEMALKADEKNLLSNVTTQNQNIVITICKEQYLRYVDDHGRYDYIENFINRYCKNELNDAFFEQRDTKQIPIFIFGLQALIITGLNKHNLSILNKLDEYIKAGGFICPSLYSCILIKLYFGFLNQNPNEKEFFEKLSKIVSDWNFSVLFGLKFAFLLTDLSNIDAPDLDCELKILDYEIFFSSFVNMYDCYHKNGTYSLREFEVRAKSFFEKHQEWLLKRDKNNKTFLYYLLLLVSKNKLPYFILKSFINTYSTVLDQTYIVQEQEKLLCQNLLKLVLKNNSIYSGLTKSDRIFLRKIVGVPEKTRLLKTKNLLSKNSEYITYCLRRLTSPLLQIAVFFGLNFLLMKVWDRVGRRFFVTKAFSRT